MSEKKPKVDKELCIGCGLCSAIAGDTFELGDDGKAVVSNPQGNPEEEIQDAIDSCPVGAISW